MTNELVGFEPSAERKAYGLVFVLSGPSGVGKDTLRQQLIDEGFPLGFCVTLTTRPPRSRRSVGDGPEEHGTDYYFVSRETFAEQRDSNKLIEHAVVHGREFYGVPRWEVRKRLREGNDVLLTVDVQGSAKLREELSSQRGDGAEYPTDEHVEIAPDARPISIFLMPPNLEELRWRLRQRGTAPEEIERRLESARVEMRRVEEYEYVVYNLRGQLDRAVDEIKAIITAERRRVKRRHIWV